MKKAFIAMSGGVDSTTAAILIKEKGYEIGGITLQLCSGGDTADARAAADKIGMPFYVLDFKQQFENTVINRFITDYENGRTPNPCVYCNKNIKFALILEKAMELGYDYIATGHYAIIEKAENGRYLLKKGKDSKKDQSYMLYALSQEVLSKTLFPLGSLSKDRVRDIARDHGLQNADKGDSQDICFIPDGRYAEFIETRTEKKYREGNFVGINGEVYGRHKGIIHYTVGQRKGLGLSFPQPMFVSKICPDTNEVILSKTEELFSKKLKANEINFIAVEDITEPIRVNAKIRYHHQEQPATVTRTGEDEITVIFDEPQRAITPGQSVVLYDGDIVVGGGVITEDMRE